MGREQRGIGQAAASERSLDDQFLLPDQAFRGYERLTAGSQSGIGARDLNRRLGALFHLILVVFIQALCQLQRLALYRNVFVEAYKVGIETSDTRNSIDHLLAEDEIRHFAAVARDSNKTRVQAFSEALQQWLSNREAKAAGSEWIVRVAVSVCSVPAIVEISADLGAIGKAHIHSDISVQGVFREPIGTREDRGVLRRCHMLYVYQPTKERIELRDSRAVRHGVRISDRKTILLFTD